jgi:hypothetical protein
LAFDSWKQGSYKIFSRICTIVKETKWIGTEIREHLVYDGTSELNSFMINMEETIVEKQRISVLDVAFQDTPS